MTNPFKKPTFERPDEPVELSKAEIWERIKNGTPFYCGKCKKQLQVRHINVCGCEDCLSPPFPKNLYGAFRIEQDIIFLDIMYTDKFDIKKHVWKGFANENA